MQITSCEMQFSCLFTHHVRPETPHAAAACDRTLVELCYTFQVCSCFYIGGFVSTPPPPPPTSLCRQVRENCCFLSPVMYCETSDLSQQGPRPAPPRSPSEGAVVRLACGSPRRPPISFAHFINCAAKQNLNIGFFALGNLFSG